MNLFTNLPNTPETRLNEISRQISTLLTEGTSSLVNFANSIERDKLVEKFYEHNKDVEVLSIIDLTQDLDVILAKLISMNLINFDGEDYLVKSQLNIHPQNNPYMINRIFISGLEEFINSTQGLDEDSVEFKKMWAICAALRTTMQTFMAFSVVMVKISQNTLIDFQYINRFAGLLVSELLPPSSYIEILNFD